jgi:chitinase
MLGFGLGFYGIYYGPGITGPRQSTARNGTYITDDRANYYGELVRLGYMDHGTLHWDEASRSSWRSYPGGYTPANDPGRPAAGYLSFESERSIAAKGQWVRETGVGGAIIWTINYGYLPDSRTNPLLAAVKQGFLQR